VKAGDILVAVESMKMEYNIKATHDAEVSEILATEGQFVEMRQKLILFK
jgi:biotin carboxyl carrier protein